ncbi:hypothetical protein LIER_31457 [Lithospermum erythrorhizon]|uniref:Uncharacterized protein n=1 Tax=Lithospermum erythrorhizon TaxID=34254 RepID=A0AAV3RR53_LITER
MKRVRERLKKLNAAKFSNISSKVAEKRIEYEGLNCKILNGDLRSDILARAAYEGDASTKFFRKSMRLHQAQNKITSIRDENGRLIEVYNEIKEVAIQFYKKMFTEHCHDVCDASMVNNVIDQRLTCNEVAMLNNPVTSQEIENVNVAYEAGKGSRS